MSDETTPSPSGWKNILLALANDPGPDERDAPADDLATELADARTELQKQDAEIRRLQDLISRMRADYHTEIGQRSDAYQAAIASTAGDAMEHRLCGMNLHAAIRRAEQAEARAAALNEEAEHHAGARVDLYALLSDLTDPDDCWFDHHGGCQAHGYLSLKPGELCPHAEAKEVLAAVNQPAESKET